MAEKRKVISVSLNEKEYEMFRSIKKSNEDSHFWKDSNSDVFKKLLYREYETIIKRVSNV